MNGVLLTANYAGIRARNGFTFLFGNRRPNGACCQPIPGFSNILISSDAKKTWYNALYLTADRPFNGRWGFSLAYTLSKAEAIGGGEGGARPASPMILARQVSRPGATAPAHSSDSRP